MELSRRDALVAVATSTAGVATAGELAERLRDREEQAGDLDGVLTRLAAVADVVYPSEVEVTESYLRTYLLGNEYDRAEYVERTGAALDELDRQGRRRYGDRIVDLSPAERDGLLREIGVDRVPPDPDGTAVERVRYYVVNQLLFTLYTSPTGGRLLGNENPPGYPGGRAAYQRGPADE
ncbi:gluconate 2-dehydrogenase subunit 3 family protein [Haloplanus pelagicus]|jgi:hypothetical protein|uniref:gluconate 2-dehydrogenase subunit 3 family protein n=1 Tax=Haloplanus pelagicus TaxID=2949995 RepID=UPI00203A9EE0|nr:gluconate 2-dehydrogenase subunit 3 family protein [Haloplanus sp. HW8-1]